MDLAIKFAPNRATDVAALVCDRLANLGQFVSAGEVMLRVKMVKEALDMFMSGEAWDRARDIARNIAPRYVVCLVTHVHACTCTCMQV